LKEFLGGLTYGISYEKLNYMRAGDLGPRAKIVVTTNAIKSEGGSAFA
jgi:hypothetical protein